MNTSNLSLPAGNVSVDVALFCNAVLSGLPMSRFLKPNIRGLETLEQVPSFSFFIQHPSGRRLLFDLGPRKDVSNLSPIVTRRMSQAGWKVAVKDDVPDILKQNGVPPESIENVVWSHWHWDHAGNMAKFPQSTTGLIVGPGFTAAMTPGYPKNLSSPILESDYSGRELIELDNFESSVAGLPAHDYFGDGSLYILSTPGHAVGHLSALARTLCQDQGTGDTFILMGGDCCHHMCQLRPSPQGPLPCSVKYSISSETHFPSGMSKGSWSSISHGTGTDRPFADISDHPNGASAVCDHSSARDSLLKLQQLDSEDGNVLFVVAHDKSLLGVVDLFPEWANDWKSKGWAEQARWDFLNDFKENFLHRK
uniref:Metallo-beta-lactamase domain-containing protein n=1 Tax=Bionectria ochroleuca TaxID=29856 RepID=A0A8H7K5V9_BIOOC